MKDPIVVLALALAAGSALARAPLPAALASIACLFLLRRLHKPLSLALFALALGVGAFRARLALDEAEALYAHVVETLGPPGRCEGDGIVLRAPVVLRGEKPAGQTDAASAGDARIEVELQSARCDRGELQEPLRVRVAGAPEDLARGDRIHVLVDVAPVHLFLNEALPNPLPFLARSGVAASGGVVDAIRLERGAGLGAWIDRARAHVRARIEATFHEEAAPLARALVLGETDLHEEDGDAFRRSGLSHLLAVSGTHLVLAVAGVCAALRALLVRIEPLAARFDVGRLSSAVAIPTSWLYADFAGGSGSALRAAGMLSFVMLVRALGLRPSGVRAFGGSLLCAALLDPLVGSDPSFVLSAAATAGLLGLSRPLERALVRGPRPLRWVLGPIATTLSAMLGCTPFLAMMTPELSLLGILANLLAAPIGELAALPVCLLHAVLSLAPSVELGAAQIGGGALLAVRVVARVTSELGGVVRFSPPTPFELAALAVATCAAIVAESRRRRALSLVLGFLAVCVLELCANRAGHPKGMLRIHALDVGQGDSLFIELPDGKSMLIDGGGFMGSPVDTGKRVVLPVLRALRRKRIDIVVLSHPHPDHFGGLIHTVPALEIGELWDTGQGEEHGAGPSYKALLRGLRDRGIPIRRPSSLCGEHAFGGVVLEVLAPCPGFALDASANDNSFVLRIRYGDRAALLVGDAEHEAEAGLVAKNPSALRADLLKVGHHGSRTSTTSDFLRAVSPSVALICSGVRNRYGHPDPLVLGRLSAFGVTIARTDRGGEIVWQTDGHDISLSQAAAR